MNARGIVAIIALGLAVPSWAGTKTRTAAFEYNPTTGRLVREVIEPGTSALCLVTTYGYDAYGNRTSSNTRNCNGTSSGGLTEAAAPTGDPVFTARGSSGAFNAGSITIGGVAYTWGAGQFATSSANALSQSESRQFDPRFGGMTGVTGPNLLTTTWTYDGLGRKTSETRADGTVTNWFYERCVDLAGACPAFGQYRVRVAATGTPTTSTYFDTLNREIRTETQGFDGTLARKDTQHDSLGRVARVSRPYYASASPVWTVYTYDTLDRVTQIDEAAASSGQTRTVTAYNNVVTATTWTTMVTVSNAGTATNMPAAAAQTKATTTNSQGQVIQVTDTQNNSLTYTYEEFGNLKTTKDALNNTSTLTYDLRGRKTQSIDPDMGTWNYFYDALGQLIRQKDAKNQTFTMVYDKLGRMTSRTDADLTSKWFYDCYPNGTCPNVPLATEWNASLLTGLTGSCAKGVGKLCYESASNGYRRLLTYDSLGRPRELKDSIDTTYTVTTAYVTSGIHLGKTDSVTYPTGFAVRNNYNAFGYLASVQRSDAGGSTVFWTANAKSASGQVTSELLGNSLTQTRGFDAVDRLASVVASGAGGTVHNFGYTYDAIGNMTQRVDAVDGVTENFAFDTLNRLLSASGPGLVTRSFNYNAIGNMTFKSDAGTYTYPTSGVGSVRPHAVSSVSGTVNATYAYDANGNLTSGAGRTLTYMSYNMPKTMARTGVTYTYTYGPEHNRVKLVTQLTTGTQTSIYLHPGGGGALFYEKEIKPGSILEHKHYVQAGPALVGVYVTKSSYTSGDGPQMRYYHRDHLGSIAAISNEAGAVIERLGYEAYGRRRSPNGTADPGGSLFGVTTDRGFTAHEHLDELGLIHMNGRVYDPLLGRFMTADPFIQSPRNLQSYNRYAYVWNNPLAGTDPSGYLNLHFDVRHWAVAQLRATTWRPKYVFDAWHSNPGQYYVDQYVMSHPWAYAAGYWAANAVTTAYTGYPWGGAVFNAYYAYEATGSETKAVEVGAVTLVADNFGPLARIAGSVYLARIMGGDETLTLKRSVGWGVVSLGIEYLNQSSGDPSSNGKGSSDGASKGAADGAPVYKPDPTMSGDYETLVQTLAKCPSYDVCGPKNVGRPNYAPIGRPDLIGTAVQVPPGDLPWANEGSWFMSAVEKYVPFIKQTSWLHDNVMGAVQRNWFGGGTPWTFTAFSVSDIPVFWGVQAYALGGASFEQGRRLQRMQ